MATEEHARGFNLYDYWPSIIGLSFGVLVFGIVLLMKGVVWPGGTLLVSYFGALLFAFIYQEVRRWPAINAMQMATLQKVGYAMEPHVIGSVGFPVAIFLFTEVMFFGGAFGMYFFIRFTQFQSWPPPGAHTLPVLIPTIQTACLITSSIMIEWALESVRKGDQLGLKVGVLGTTLLGSAFYILQFGIEWPHFIFDHILSLRDFYGASFFLLTGIHGSHVLGGVVVLIITFVRAILGQFDERSHGFLEAVSTYWHFVHIVWLFLFALLFQQGLSYLQI